MTTAMIAGATGLVGGHLLRDLLEAREYGPVVALGRRPTGVSHPKLIELTVDFSALEPATAGRSVDDAFCCLGTTMRQVGTREAFRAVDHTAVLAFAWAVRRAGARRFFLVSALGADPAARLFYNRVKGETEQALAVLGFDTLAVFRPALLRGARREWRAGERLLGAAMRLLDPLLCGGWRKYRSIHAAVVARAMLRCSFGRPGVGRLTFESDEIEDLGR